jgi:hypothetical protein
MGVLDTPEGRLRAFYGHFAQGEFRPMGRFLGDTAVYWQPQYMTRRTILMGRTVVVAEYMRWGERFRGLIVDHLELTKRPDLINSAEVGPGAAHCFEVTYLLAGRYTTAIPDLRVQLQADGSLKQLAVTDHVWLDPNLAIRRIHSKFQPVSG